MMNTMMNNKEGVDAFKNMMGGADKGKKPEKAAFNKMLIENPWQQIN